MHAVHLLVGAVKLGPHGSDVRSCRLCTQAQAQAQGREAQVSGRQRRHECGLSQCGAWRWWACFSQQDGEAYTPKHTCKTAVNLPCTPSPLTLLSTGFRHLPPQPLHIALVLLKLGGRGLLCLLRRRQLATQPSLQGSPLLFHPLLPHGQRLPQQRFCGGGRLCGCRLLPNHTLHALLQRRNRRRLPLSRLQSCGCPRTGLLNRRSLLRHRCIGGRSLLLQSICQRGKLLALLLQLVNSRLLRRLLLRELPHNRLHLSPHFSHRFCCLLLSRCRRLLHTLCLLLHCCRSGSLPRFKPSLKPRFQGGSPLLYPLPLSLQALLHQRGGSRPLLCFRLAAADGLVQRRLQRIKLVCMGKEGGEAGRRLRLWQAPDLMCSAAHCPLSSTAGPEEPARTAQL